MTNTATVGPEKVVSFHYVLKNDGGDVIDMSEEGFPQLYLHGAQNIIPGLEQAMSGHAAGDQFSIAVPPEEGYGRRFEDAVQKVERSVIPPEVPLRVGMQLGMEGPDGQALPAWVTEVNDEHVVLDFNHPLAGQTLHFELMVAEVRSATSVELEQGHPTIVSSCCSDPNCSSNK